MSSTASIIAKLEKDIEKLKLKLKKEPKTKKNTSKKPKNIEDCNSKDELKKFTVKELKEWLKNKKINVKKITEKHKDDFVTIVWKNIKEQQESSSSDSDSSDSDSSDSDSD